MHEESLAISRELADMEGIAWSLHHLGSVASAWGDLGAARKFQEESLMIFRDLGNRQGAAWSLNDMGKAVGTQGDFSAAGALYRESISIQKELGDKRGVAAGLRGLAALMSQTPKKAARLWGAAESLRASIGARLIQNEQELCDRQLGQTRAALGEFAFSAAWREGQAMTMEQAADYALEDGDQTGFQEAPVA